MSGSTCRHHTEPVSTMTLLTGRPYLPWAYLPRPYFTMDPTYHAPYFTMDLVTATLFYFGPTYHGPTHFGPTYYRPTYTYHGHHTHYGSALHADRHVLLAIPPPLPGYHPMPDGRAPIAAEGSQGDSALLVRPGRWLGVGPTLTPTPALTPTLTPIPTLTRTLNLTPTPTLTLTLTLTPTLTPILTPALALTLTLTRCVPTANTTPPRKRTR